MKRLTDDQGAGVKSYRRSAVLSGAQDPGTPAIVCTSRSLACPTCGEAVQYGDDPRKISVQKGVLRDGGESRRGLVTLVTVSTRVT